MKTAISSPDDDFNRKKPGGAYTNAASEGSHVPNRANDPRRRPTEWSTSPASGAHYAVQMHKDKISASFMNHAYTHGLAPAQPVSGAWLSKLQKKPR